MKPKAPCKDCPDRTIEPNCHNTCEKYKAWKAEYQKSQAEEKERKLRDRESFLRSERVENAHYRAKKGYDQ